VITAEDVKRYAKQCGADVVGIGSMDRFEGAPKQQDPRHMMPEATSIIIMGFRIFRGLMRGIEEGTWFYGYSSMGYAGINFIYQPVVLWNFSKMIEDEGYEALPVPNNFPWSAIDFHDTGRLHRGWSRPVSPDKPAPDAFINLRIAAFIAGLGEIGYSKMFLTPEFGPRQRLAAVLTDLPLEPDPIYDGPELCDQCMACVADCPTDAISRTETVKVDVAGRHLEWGEKDTIKCSAGFTGRSYDSDADELRERNRDAPPHAYNPFIRSMPPAYEYGRALGGARGCIRACMIHLEEQGKLKNAFKAPFRRRKPWKLS
jgi:epoxyqueuosine reductase